MKQNWNYSLFQPTTDELVLFQRLAIWNELWNSSDVGDLSAELN